MTFKIESYQKELNSTFKFTFNVEDDIKNIIKKSQ